MIEKQFINPFGTDPELELPHPLETKPLWTEFYYFFGYDPDAQMGLTIHIGREPFDSSIFRATVCIYMPGQELLVAKYSGRDGNARGPGAGPLRITCVEPMRLFTLEFDGVCQATTRAKNMAEVHPDSPGEPVKFFLRFEGAGPLWDMAKKLHAQSWGSQHLEQICRVKGHFVVRGKRVHISGAGVRDHSSGPRDYGPVTGNFWANMLFDDGACVQAQLTRSASLESELRNAYIFRNDGSPLEVCEVLECPDVCTDDTPAQSEARDPLTDESLRKFQIVLKSQRGREVIGGELVHSAAVTYLAPNDELLGTDFNQLQAPVPNALQLTESATLYSWNGVKGVGVRERVSRIRALK